MEQTADTTSGQTLTLSERLAKNADGVLENIAREYGVSTFDVIQALPEGKRVIVDGEQFGDVMQAVTEWGDILFIVHTPDIVLECAGSLPPGTVGRGYFNLHGESPIGGHIRADNCKHIAFIDRAFFGRRSCSIQFFNGFGETMFKIFVRRDKERNLIPEQVEMFKQLRSALALL